MDEGERKLTKRWVQTCIKAGREFHKVRDADNGCSG
jgi:hypothetical protein